MNLNEVFRICSARRCPRPGCGWLYHAGMTPTRENWLEMVTGYSGQYSKDAQLEVDQDFLTDEAAAAAAAAIDGQWGATQGMAFGTYLDTLDDHNAEVQRESTRRYEGPAGLAAITDSPALNAVAELVLAKAPADAVLVSAHALRQTPETLSGATFSEHTDAVDAGRGKGEQLLSSHSVSLRQGGASSGVWGTHGGGQLVVYERAGACVSFPSDALHCSAVPAARQYSTLKLVFFTVAKNARELRMAKRIKRG